MMFRQWKCVLFLSAFAGLSAHGLAFLEDKRPACLAMVQDFCSTLFSPDNQGSLNFSIAGSNYNIRMGETANDFQEDDYEFMKAQLASWSKLPAEFRANLEENEYKAKLSKHLKRAARKEMTLKDRISNMRSEEEIDSIWNLAFRETVLTKMENQVPGYAKIKEDFMPLELRYESQRQRRLLTSRVAKALWSEHVNWKNVEAKFAHVRETYKKALAEMDIPKEVKSDWQARLDAIGLQIPGADPEVETGNCYKDEPNAYYFRDRNYITVCAGDFNSEEIEQTIAHEMSHALDIGRSRFIYQQKSPVGNQLADLKERSCGKKAFTCEQWNETKSKFNEHLKFLLAFKPQLRHFNQCLQEKSVKAEIPDDYLSRISREDVEGTLSDLAKRNVFLRIISPELPLPNGKTQRNPMYMNPCGYYLWDTQAQPLDDDVSLLLFFTAEYRCSPEKDRAERFKQAIETAKQLQTDLAKNTIAMEGEFSGRYRLDRDGYSSAPTERFADSLGQMVFARILKEEPSVQKRRARYLANNAWLCRKPSIQQLFPSEAKVQRSYYVEPHSETNQRQKELLTEEIRESLECKRDFEAEQCEL
jgi:hypothetical protein